MDLPHSYRQTLELMPDMGFGEDRSDYCRRVVEWGRQQGIGTTECLRCANIKWEAWEMEQLIDRIAAEGIFDAGTKALREGVIRLLKDRYLP